MRKKVVLIYSFQNIFNVFQEFFSEHISCKNVSKNSFWKILYICILEKVLKFHSRQLISKCISCVLKILFQKFHYVKKMFENLFWKIYETCNPKVTFIKGKVIILKFWEVQTKNNRVQEVKDDFGSSLFFLTKVGLGQPRAQNKNIDLLDLLRVFPGLK